jgi:hypothetical protein
MQTAELVELAVLIVRQAPTLPLVESTAGLGGIESYWAASKCRFDRWGRTLKQLSDGDRQAFDVGGGTARGLVEEILGSEVLTRIWTAVVAAFDRRRGTQDNDIVVRSVYIGHLEMRHRVLKLLCEGTSLPWRDAVDLNRLRRRTELWTDMLLAPLAVRGDAREFAFEPDRLRQFAEDLAPGGAVGADGCDPAEFLEASVQAAAKSSLRQPAPTEDLNRSVAAAVLEAFPAQSFDAHGLFRSLWILRLTATADDTQRLIDELFHSESLPPPELPPSRRLG